MFTTGERLTTVRPLALRRRRGRLGNFLHFLRSKPLGAFGLVIVLVLIGLAIFAEQAAPYNPNIQGDDLLQGPSLQHLLGTDNFGRDQFSRIIHGARISLAVSLIAVAFGTISGAILGLVSGYFGGRLDLSIQRVMDAQMAFPSLVLALAIIAALGPGFFNVILAIGATAIPRSARVVRSATLAVKETEYVVAARALGAPPWRVMALHVGPGCVAPYLIVASAGLGGAILAETSLSFLGLGVPPPAPSWGGMLTGAARKYLEQAPWLSFFPGLAISLVVYGFNLLGDAVRDALDPKLRGR